MLVSVGLLLAWAMPPLSATVVWGWIFDTQYGVVNWALNTITGTNDWTNHSWLINPWSFFFVLTIIIVWQGVPFVAFTTYAALGQVPGEVLEAAALDGATGIKRFRFVVFPYLRSVLLGRAGPADHLEPAHLHPGLRAAEPRRARLRDERARHLHVPPGAGGLRLHGAIGVVMVVLLLVLSWGYVRSTLKEEEL